MSVSHSGVTRCRSSVILVVKHEATMKATSLLFAFAVLVQVGCNSRDGVMTQSLVGTWVYKSDEYPGTMVFNADGNFSADWSRVQAGQATSAHKFTGRWQIRNETLIQVISTSNSISIKLKDKSRIISLNKDEFTYQHLDAPMTLRRVN
jgi:hypothetical protein